MTYKEKLLKFVEIKASILRRSSSIQYIDKGDINEIKNWSKKNCEEIYKLIVKYVNFTSSENSFDSITCPWCVLNFYIKFYANCYKCVYGKRHGICKKQASKYQRLVNEKAFIPLTKNKYIEIINRIENNIEDSSDL